MTNTITVDASKEEVLKTAREIITSLMKFNQLDLKANWKKEVLGFFDNVNDIKETDSIQQINEKLSKIAGDIHIGLEDLISRSGHLHRPFLTTLDVNYLSSKFNLSADEIKTIEHEVEGFVTEG